MSATQERQLSSVDSTRHGYQRVRLGDVCTAIRGVTFASGEASDSPFDGSIACLTTSGVQTTVDWASRRFIPDGKSTSRSQRLQEGDILVSTANSKALVGKSCLVEDPPFPCTFGAFVTTLRPSSEIIPQFLAHRLRAPDAMTYFFVSSSNTTNISNLRVRDMLAFQLDLPPIDTQQRIADRLTQQMAAVDRAKACSVAQIEAAAAFERSILRSVFGSLDASTWHLMSVGQMRASGILREHQDGNHGELYPRSRDFVPTGVKFLSAKHIVRDGSLLLDQAPHISTAQASTLRIGHAQGGDVLLAHNATVGPVAMAPDGCEPFVVGTSLTVFRPDPENLLPRFLFYALKSDLWQKQLVDAMKQTTRNQVPITRQRELELPVPRIDQQREIVASLDRRYAATYRLIPALEGQEEAIRELPAVIMRDTFCGGL